MIIAIGILLISIAGQSVYAAQKRSDKGLRRQYASYNKRVKRVRKKVHRVTVHHAEGDFKYNPQELLRYKLEKGVDQRELPVESPELAAQIHGLKRLHAYASGASNSSVGTKIAPIELDAATHSDVVSANPAVPLCSCCVIL